MDVASPAGRDVIATLVDGDGGREPTRRTGPLLGTHSIKTTASYRYSEPRSGNDRRNHRPIPFVFSHVTEAQLGWAAGSFLLLRLSSG